MPVMNWLMYTVPMANVKTLPVLVSVLASLLIAGDFYVCFAPPWPEHELNIALSMLIPWLAVVGLRHWLVEQPWAKYWPIVMVAAAFLYLLMYCLTVYYLPDRWYRDIGGFRYSEKSNLIREMNPGISTKELFRRLDNDPTLVFATTSVHIARFGLLVSWFAFATAASVGTSLLVEGRLREAELESVRSSCRWQVCDFTELPRFVDRDARCLEPILRAANCALGGSVGQEFDRMTATSRSRIAQAIYHSVASTTELKYDYEPATPGASYQEVRLAGGVVKYGVATCIDLSLFYAALLERSHMPPAILVLERNGGLHAIGGFFELDAERTVDQLCTDKDRLQNIIDSGSVVLIETMGLATYNGRKMSFEEAKTEALIAVREGRPLALINVLAARGRGCQPPPQPATYTPYPLA